MKLIEKIKNRYNIMIFILALMMIALTFKLSILTIVNGDKYREDSDTKRIKEIYTTAPRGEIRDKNGVVLAASRRSFTVQLLKDEIEAMKNLDNKNKNIAKDQKNARVNKVFLDLTRLLEEDGTFYKDEYPIVFNNFSFKSESDYDIEEKSPTDKVVEIMVNNNLIREFLDTYYINNEYGDHFKYITVNKVISAIRAKGYEVPIIAELGENGVEIKFDTEKDIIKWKKDNGMHPDAEIKSTILFLIGEDTNIINRILDNSVARKLAYDLLVSKDLTSNIIMEDISFTYDDEYKNQKRKLMKNFDKISFETTGEEDFINIVWDSSVIDDLLLFYEETEDGKKTVVPGEILMKLIKDKELESPVELLIEETENGKKIKYISEKTNDNNENIKILKDFILKNNLRKDFLLSDGVRNKAQSFLLEKEINPGISVAKKKEIDYISKNERNLLINKIKNSEKLKNENITLDENSPAKDVFKGLVAYYEIDKQLSNYEKRGILNFYSETGKQGYRGYEPINIAYDVKDETVAKIEEGFLDIPAVKVSNEPIRYYPKGNHMSHIIGHLGKISTDYEIEKYVDGLKYSKNDIIGKMGLEESFEETLRGKNGSRKVEVDSIGNTTSTLGENKSEPGKNIYLTIDSRLQEASEKIVEEALNKIQVGGVYQSEFGNYKFSTSKKTGAFKNATSAAAVVVDVKTGELLSSVSYPSFNPNLFATGISSVDWNSLQPEDDRDKLAPRPLLNIVTQTAVQPGSTFKMVTGLTAMEKGFSPNRTIRDRGYYEIGDTLFRCLIWSNYKTTHGNVNFYDALKVSCNYYFYSLAMGDNGIQIKIEDIVETATKLGLNDKSGLEINIPKEASGRVPTPESNLKTNQAIFRRFLDSNIDKTILEGTKIDNETRKKNIEEIVSWTELNEEMTKNEVIRALRELGYDGEVRIGNGREDLADSIKYTYLRGAGWGITDTLNVTIGQGQNAYTPIQMANAVATMVNGGKHNKINVVDRVTSYDDKEVLEKNTVEFKETDFNISNLEAVKEGMRRVTSVNRGTAEGLFKNFPVQTGAKTGTAENKSINPVTGGSYDDYSWFVAFGPYEDPEIAVAVLVFQGGSGGNSGLIAREIMGEYFKLNGTIGNEENEENEEFETNIGN